MSLSGSRSLLWASALVTVCALVIPNSTLAQDDSYPKVDVFTGYQWINPGGTVPSNAGTPNHPVPLKLRSIPQGLGAGLTYNFNKYLGLEGDYGGNFNKDGNESTGSFGPRLMYRGEGVNYFVHTLLGVNDLHPKGVGSNYNIGAILGGGMDLKIFRPLSFRVFEADYVWTRHNFSERASPAFPELRRPTFNGVRLRSGLVFNFGYPPEEMPKASCSVQPTEVMVGEPVTASVNATGFNPKHTLTYTWTSTGGKVAGKDASANIDTNGVAGGSYTVTAKVADPKMKKGGEVMCTANFTVKEPPKNPPTMSCSANPTNVQTGGTSTITCDCKSPDNVTVNVENWTASSGTISGTGNTATLNTSGASPGPVTVNATCTDSRGLNVSASTQVTVEAPPPPPPQASKLSSCDYPNEKKPWRVDNTCKAVLDDVAARLQHEPDAKLVVVGNSAPDEKRKNLAGERAVDAKAYLSGGEAKQGIDASRIETRTGTAGTKTADFWIVPAGANFTEEGTTPVDESVVKPIPDHPAPAKKKRAAKPKTP